MPTAADSVAVNLIVWGQSSHCGGLPLFLSVIQKDLSAMNSGSPTGPIVKQKPSPSGFERFHVLSSDGHRYLYVSGLNKLFGLSNELSRLTDSEIAEFARRINLDRFKHYKSTFSANNVDSDEPLRDVVIHVSQKCNLACIYCYASELTKAAASMSIEVAKKVISHTLSLSKNGLWSVKFLGGEPTTAWPIVERIVEGYQEYSSKKGFSPPVFVVVTNGTKITRRMIDFSHKNRIFFWVSLDGPQEIHDRLRPTRMGGGSYSKVIKSISDLFDGGVRVGIETVFTKLHLDKGITPQDLLNHFLSLGIREVQISPVVGTWHGCETIAEIKQVTKQFEQAARNSIRSFRTQDPYLLRGIDFVLRGYVGQIKNPYVCGAGRTFMAINYDGEAFPCYLMESRSTSYGWIGDHWRQSRFEQIRTKFSGNSKAHHPECLACWASEICKSCLGVGFQITKKIGKPPGWFCAFQKSLVSGVLAEIANASDSDEWPLFMRNVAVTLGLSNERERTGSPP